MGNAQVRNRSTVVNPWIKWLMFSFNMLFWIVSVPLIAIGSWAHYESSNHQKQIDGAFDIIFNVSTIFIIVGCLVFIVSFLGALGALRENIYLLMTFMIMLIIICVAELALGIAALVLINTMDGKVAEYAKIGYIEEYRDDIDRNNIIDWLQETFECCGVGADTRNGYQDWEQNKYFSCDSPGFEACSVPFSCCKNPYTYDDQVVDTRCGAGMLSDSISLSVRQEKIHVIGCFNVLYSKLEDNLAILGGIAIAILIPQLIGIILSRILYGQIQMQKDQYNPTSDLY